MADVVTKTDEFVQSTQLPSRGMLYEGRLPDGQISMRPMKTVDEKLFAGNSASQNDVLDTLLKRCFVTEFPYEDLLISDKLYMLVFLRGITYGWDYGFDLTCGNPTCKAKYRHQIKIPDDFEITMLDESDVEPYVVDLPISKRKVELRQLRVKDEIEVQRFVKRSLVQAAPRDDGDPAYIPRLAKQIVSVDGRPTPWLDAMRLCEGLHSRDSLEIRNTLDTHESGIDIMIRTVCPVCATESEEVTPLSREFFRPGFSSVRKRG